MLKLDDYISNGSVAREKIVFDIERQIITRNDIETLASHEAVSKSFFGKGVPFKKGKQYWDKNYLNKLQCAVVAECFNEEYLYHLYDVAEYLKNTKKRKVFIKVGLGTAVILILVGIVVLINFK